MSAFQAEDGVSITPTRSKVQVWNRVWIRQDLKLDTRGEAIIRRRGGSPEIRIAKSSVQCSDTEPCGTDKARVVVSSGLRTLIHMVGMAEMADAPDCGSGFRGFNSHYSPQIKEDFWFFQKIMI